MPKIYISFVNEPYFKSSIRIDKNNLYIEKIHCFSSSQADKKYKID